MSRIRRVTVTMGLCAAIGVTVTCVAVPRVQPIQADHAAALHAVHSEHVASLMKSISRSHQSVRSHRQPLLLARERQYKAIAAHAKEIIGFAGELKTLAQKEELSTENRGLFLVYVDTLCERAAELQAAAEREDEVNVKRAFARFTATCNGCHSAFREPIQAHKASE